MAELQKDGAKGWDRQTAACVVIALVLVAAYALAVWTESANLPPIDDSDEGGYFEEALWIAENGGIAGFVGACFRGEYSFYQRHPLAGILAYPVAGRSLERVRPMRFVKVLASAVALGGTIVLLWRMTGPGAALFLSALLAVSINWYAKARVVCAEPLVYAPFFAAWALMAGKLRWRRRWFWAGVFWGLAYLAKGTAMLLLFALPPAWCLAALIRYWRRRELPRIGAWRDTAFRRILPFALGAFLLAGPLLVRNAIRFGNPLSNLAQRCMWLDSWTEHIQLYEDPSAEKPSLSRYLETHSTSDMVGRMAFGIRKQAPRLLGGLSADGGFGRVARIATLILSCGLMLGGLVAATATIRSWSGAYTVALLAAGSCLFSWYAYISYASRFMASFAPILGLYAMVAGTILIRRRTRSRRAVRMAGIAAACLAIALLAGRARWTGLTLPRGPVPATPEFAYLYNWFKGHGDMEGTCFLTPYLAPRYSMAWLVKLDGPKCFNLPPLDSFEELQHYMAQRRARYLIVERDSLRERLDLLGDYFGITPENALTVRKTPSGWRIIERDPHGALDFVILERVPDAP